jgi:hypothetical protein
MPAGGAVAEVYARNPEGNYRLLAQYFLALAQSCSEPSETDRYRAIAADYF